MNNCNKKLMFYGASPLIFENAKELRNNQTIAEHVLWSELRNKQLGGFRFKRQHPIQQFIADFYCHKLQLVIEVDGEIHNVNENKEKDKIRTQELKQLGIQVIRFTNDEVLYDTENVIYKIKEIILNKLK